MFRFRTGALLLLALLSSCHKPEANGTEPVYESSAQALTTIRVAVYNHSSTFDLAGFTGNNDNPYSAIASVLSTDPSSRFSVTTVTSLSASTLANFDRIVLPDNGVTTTDLAAVSNWFQPGTGIIAIDSAVCYACYSGFLVPASAGASGQNTYWDYNSGSNDQKIALTDPDTSGYTVGQIISSNSSDAELLPGALPSDVVLFSKSNNSGKVYGAYRDVPGRGRITFLGPINPGATGSVSNDEKTLLRNAVANVTQPLTNGTACTAATQCASGFCSDGVCCNSACSGSCDACSVAAGAVANGTCTILAGTATGSPSCAPYLCSGTSANCPTSCSVDGQCASGNYCNSSGQCVPQLTNNSTCTAGDQCLTGNCPDGICCTYSGSCYPYVCDNTQAAACYTTCSTDAQCATGLFCSNGQCLSKLKQGDVCSGNNQCQSSFCSDGFCCNSACSGGCDVCAFTLGATADGTCTNLPKGSTGESNVCSPFICTGTSGACPTSCSTDSQCITGDYCQGNQCFPKVALGGSCTANNQCVSGNCADGVCCNSACNGGCDVCSKSLGASADGTCTVIPQGSTGQNPSCSPFVCNGTSAACPSTCSADTDCAPTAYCAGNTCRARVSQGGACTANDQCLTNFCVDGVCCNSTCNGACDACSLATGAKAAGQCTILALGAAGSPSCTPYTCGGTSASCPTSCTSDSGCASGFFCDLTSNACVPKNANGATCTRTAECTSGLCVDGVCCNSTCTGGCNACNLAGSMGTCTVMSQGSTGNPSCSPFVCDGVSANCATSCTSDLQCPSGQYCNGGSCAAQLATGSACTRTTQCSSGFCADGFCCNSACNGSCDVCSATLGATANGQCTPAAAGKTGSPSCSPYLCNGTNTSCPTGCTADSQCATGNYCDATGHCAAAQTNGAACTSATQCASGNCVDGFCCNNACNGSCNFCAASLGATANGVCTNVAGATGTPSCGTYVCSSQSPSCPSTCNSDSQCATGAYCSGNKCVSAQQNGGACTSARQCTSGNCVDGVCCNTACSGSCDVCSAKLGATQDGTCSPAPAGSLGSPACFPYFCDGKSTTCSSTCANDASCGTGYFCDATNHCAPTLTNGATCSRLSQCASGNCVDGVCCNTGCNGSCDFCAKSLGAAADGVCTAVAGALGSPSCAPYLCTGASASCPMACVTDAQCVAGTFCSGGACVPAQQNGAVCTEARQCTSGNCVDGVCCNSSCDGSCDVCSAQLGATADGTCTVAPTGSAGSPSCAPFLCDGMQTTCATSCTLDSDCVASAYCNGGTCSPKQTNGATCTSTNQCASGNCVDGICCNTSCDGACAVCTAAKGATVDGTCSPAPLGTAALSCSPYVCDGTSGLCPTGCAQDTDCVTGSYCNAQGQCTPVNPIGNACSADDQCLSGHCADGVCCDTACDSGCDVCAQQLGATADGTCTVAKAGVAGDKPTCNPYLCDGKNAACPTACAQDTDCVAGDYCAGGKCTPKQLNGTTCSSTDQCSSGFCVDGVCCNTACSDQCAACNVGPTPGVCSPAPMGTPVGMRPACATDGSLCGGQCDGQTTASCSYPSAMVSCGMQSCSDGTNTPAPLCNGMGACMMQQPVACTPYTCGAGGCGTGCQSDQDCASGNYCDSGKCVPVKKQGDMCAADSNCGTGFCVSGVCCDTACQGSCGSCTLPGLEGTCSSVAKGTAPENGDCAPLVCDGSNTSCPELCMTSADCATGFICADGRCEPKHDLGGTCSSADDCGSGFCVDGLCCESACEGSCVTCAASGHEGQCTPVKGEPAPGREACHGSGVCGGSCDGTQAACAYPKTDTVCAPAFCAESVATAEASCDGAGSCAPGQQTTCASGCSGDHCAPVPQKAKGGGCASTESSTVLALAAALAWLARRRMRGAAQRP